MAVTIQNSTEKTAGYRGKPVNDHGKLRIQYFDLPATTVAGDATSEVNLCKLPFGEIRVIGSLSRISHSAFGAARTLDVGHREYQKRDDPAATLEPEDDNAFISALDVSGAGVGVAFGTSIDFDLYSKGGVNVYATVKGGTIPIGATISGFMVYVHE